MIGFSGDKRSGKTMTMAFISLLDSKKHKIISSIPGLTIPHHKLKWIDLLIYKEDPKNPKRKIPTINWPFWIEHQGESIYIDEIHNLLGHLEFGTKESKALKKWLSQIGKVQLDSGNWNELKILRIMNSRVFNKYIYRSIIQEANFYYNSQRTRFIDVYCRELTDVHVHCYKDYTKEGKLRILNDWYFSDGRYSAMDIFEEQLAEPKTSYFLADALFNTYQTHRITTDGSEYV